MTKDYHKRLQYLFQQYLNDQISKEEYAEFWESLQEQSEKDDLLAGLQALWERGSHEETAIPQKQWEAKMQKLIDATATTDKQTKIRKINKRKVYGWSAAAFIFLLVGSSVYFLRHSESREIVISASSEHKKNNGLVPGGNKAILTLANGSSILLDSVTNGMISRQGKTLVVKSDSNRVTYKPGGAKAGDVVYNTLRTPRGGKYQITLPDGTKVWLNAASSLRFPTAFPGRKRLVAVTGEAYFEVAENAEKPFVVSVNGMKVKVLGTHFNIKAYDDEPVIKTTLLEGAVMIEKGTETLRLSPGQQVTLNKKGRMLLIKDADISKAIAWKDNLFWFKNNTIQEVMRQIARWYDADVVIKGNIPQHFTGSISQNVDVHRVFSILQETGNIHFEVKGHQIIVTP